MRIFISQFFSLLVLTLLATGQSIAAAEQFNITFVSTVDRVILPSGEVLTDPLTAGSKLSGKAVLSLKDTKTHTKNPYVAWKNAVKTLNFGGDLSVQFSGGNLSISGEQLRLSPQGSECFNCKAEGSELRTKGTDKSGNEITKSYIPIQYVLVQGGGHEIGLTSFEQVVNNMVSMANGGETKIMLQYSDKASDPLPPLRIVLSVLSMKIDR